MAKQSRMIISLGKGQRTGTQVRESQYPKFLNILLRSQSRKPKTDGIETGQQTVGKIMKKGSQKNCRRSSLSFWYPFATIPLLSFVIRLLSFCDPILMLSVLIIRMILPIVLQIEILVCKMYCICRPKNSTYKVNVYVEFFY